VAAPCSVEGRRIRRPALQGRRGAKSAFAKVVTSTLAMVSEKTRVRRLRRKSRGFLCSGRSKSSFNGRTGKQTT